VLVIAAAAFLAFVWVRGARRNRARWLARLDLPGIWSLDGESGEAARLELTGGLDRGEYRIREGDLVETGRWHLEGHTLKLTTAGGRSNDYDLRLFSEGKIGIDGPGRERRIYTKVPSNVVPLRRTLHQ
jgi:hypothetical protein